MSQNSKSGIWHDAYLVLLVIEFFLAVTMGTCAAITSGCAPSSTFIDWNDTELVSSWAQRTEAFYKKQYLLHSQVGQCGSACEIYNTMLAVIQNGCGNVRKDVWECSLYKAKKHLDCSVVLDSNGDCDEAKQKHEEERTKSSSSSEEN